MLEEPGVADQRLLSVCRERYGLAAVEVAFLPLGVDRRTAAYRVDARDDTPYFLKLRRSNFREISVTIPRYLSDQGIAHIIRPLPTMEGRLWVNLDTFTLTLYPFFPGQDGYQVELTAGQWRELGTALKQIHTVSLPTSMRKRIPQETYAPVWRQTLERFLGHMQDHQPADPVAAELVAFLQARRHRVRDLLDRAEHLAQQLRSHPPDVVLCHSDVHPGNLLITPAGALYIVDWDEPLLAPKERDLMFIGGGHCNDEHSTLDEQALFYQGYGPTTIDPVAIAYYRYQRIVEDIAIFSERIFSAGESRQDREQALRYLKSNFLPGNTIDTAYKLDKSAGIG